MNNIDIHKTSSCIYKFLDKIAKEKLFIHKPTIEDVQYKLALVQSNHCGRS